MPRNRSPPTTSSSWAPAGTASPPPTTSPRTTASPTSAWSRRDGWGGNMARNTTIIRSNYLWDESAAIYEHSLRLWEGSRRRSSFDMQFSQRGVLNLAHDLGDVRSSVRRVEANRLNGIDAEWLDAAEVKEFCPIVNVSPHAGTRCSARPCSAGRRRPPRPGRVGVRARGGSPGRRHRRARRGHGVPVEHGRAVQGVKTTRGTIGAEKVALAAAGHTSVLASMVGLRLPLRSHPLQALVSAATSRCSAAS